MAREEEKRVWKEYRTFLQTNSSKDRNDIDQALVKLRQQIVSGASVVDIEKDMDSLNPFYEEGAAKGISQWEMALNLFMFTSSKKLGGRNYSEVANERGTVLLDEVLNGRTESTKRVEESTHLTEFSFVDQLEIYHLFSTLNGSSSQFSMKALEKERFWESAEVRYLFCVLAGKYNREELAKEIAATLPSDDPDYMVIRIKYGIPAAGQVLHVASDENEEEDWGWEDFWEGSEDWDDDEYDDDDDDDDEYDDFFDDDDDDDGYFDDDDEGTYNWDDDEFWAMGRKKNYGGYSGGGYYQEQPYRRETPKVGRNDPCPCGSGKKYKNCCGK